MDETGFYLDQHSKYVIAETGTRNVISIASENREHATVVCHAAASGKCGRPYFLIPRNINNFLENHFEGSQVMMTSKGYMDNNAFEEWAKHGFKRYG